jgi:hypothetical protein
VSETSGTQGKRKQVPEAAGENLDTGTYEGAGETGNAPIGTYAGLPTDATGGPPSVGGQIMGAGGIGAGTVGNLPTPSATGEGGPAGTGTGALGGTTAPPLQQGMGGNQTTQANQANPNAPANPPTGPAETGETQTMTRQADE